MLTVPNRPDLMSGMKSNRPISDFFMRMQTFRANDVAVLFAMVALSEVSQEFPVSPAVKKRIWAVELSGESLSESIDRLIELGEIEWVEENVQGQAVQGYRVVRFGEFQESLCKLGHRTYMRNKKRESRMEEAV
jgi:hypothetical protein